MGFIKRSELGSIFDRLRQDSLCASASSCSILIMCAVNVDSLCALKIIMGVLQSEYIQFKVEPVCGYDDISTLSRLHGASLRSVVLIGCGATADVASFLRLPDRRCAVYVFDPLRPHSLDNLFNNSQAFIADDGSVEAEESRLREAFNGSMIESEGDDGDHESSDSSTDNQNVDSQENMQSNSSKRKGRLRRKFVEYHTQSHQCGTSSALLAFELADQLNKTNNAFLWCAIVGSVSHYLLDYITRKQWEERVAMLRRQLSRFNPLSQNAPLSDSNRIRTEHEYRFMLCRFWNIHDSMLHSRYVASRLQLWRDRGWKRLTELLASMGIPLEACRRDWFVMEKTHRDVFGSNLQRYAARFGLSEVTFPSFVRECGYEMMGGMGAGDAFYVLSAILESPIALSMGSPPASGALVDRLDLVRNNFAFALQALDYQYLFTCCVVSKCRKGTGQLREGVRLAIAQQQVLFRQLSSIFTHRVLRYGRRYRYAVLRGTVEQTWFHHPSSILRLALFLADAQLYTRKSHLPLLLAAHQPVSDSFLVVAVNGNTEGRSHARSSSLFGQAYRAAAELCRARIRHDSFDATVIEVAADDLKPFIQTLQKIVY